MRLDLEPLLVLDFDNAMLNESCDSDGDPECDGAKLTDASGSDCEKVTAADGSVTS